MLMLTRSPGERILLKCPNGQEIWITVGYKNKREISLGIDAPKDVQILREEIINKPKK